MRIDETLYNRLPAKLQALFRKLPNPGSDEVVAGFPGNNGDCVARYFYTAKASSDDRDGSKHPTMKPTDLMRYLCRLVTPPNGVVLDPFMGSGTTGKAARLEGFRFVGVDQDEGYCRDARRRIGQVETNMFAEASA